MKKIGSTIGVVILLWITLSSQGYAHMDGLAALEQEGFQGATCELHGNMDGMMYCDGHGNMRMHSESMMPMMGAMFHGTPAMIYWNLTSVLYALLLIGVVALVYLSLLKVWRESKQDV